MNDDRASAPVNGLATNGKHIPSGKSRKSQRKKRVTFIIPPELDTLLEIYCSTTEQLKNEVVAAAIAEHVSRDRKRFQKAVEATTQDAAIDRFVPPTTARAGRI